jgi:PST family polysaccharide transporter
VLQKILKNDFIQNVVTGSFIRFTSFIFPYILTTPYLIRTLGEGQFGLVSFAIGFVSLFYPIIEYGFLLTAPKDIGLHIGNDAEVGRIASRVLFSKLILLVFTALLISLVIIFHPKLWQEKSLHFIALSLVIGQALAPIWLYQGLKQLHLFSFYNLAINICVFVGTYIFVKSAKDYERIILIQGVVWIAGFGTALWLSLRKYGKYIVFSWEAVLGEIKSGRFIFYTNLLHFTFVAANMVILGFYATGKHLDDYSYSEKIYLIFRYVLGIVYQMAYPKTFHLKLLSEQKANQFLKKLSLGLGGVFLVISTFLFVGAEYIILIFTGKPNPEASDILKILAFAPFVYALTVPMSQKILVFYSQKAFSLILLSVVIFNILVNLMLTPQLYGKGTAFSFLLTELFFLALAGSYILYNIKFRKNNE